MGKFAISTAMFNRKLWIFLNENSGTSLETMEVYRKRTGKKHYLKAGKTHYYPVVNGRSDKGSVWGIQKFPTNIPYLI